MSPPRLKRGDLAVLYWLDIAEHGAANPATAHLEKRGPTATFYWSTIEDGGVSCGVFSSTYEPEDPSQQGYLIIPWCLVSRVTRKR